MYQPKLFAFLPILTFVLFAKPSAAQSYMLAGGLRTGTEWGLSAKQRLARRLTGELIAQNSLRRDEFMLSALVERHYPLAIRHLNVFLGGGLHKGWIDSPANTEGNAAALSDPFGVSLIGGAEITLGRLNVSYDWKPAVNIAGGESRFYVQTGVSVRYVFTTDKNYQKKLRKKRREQRRNEGRGIHLGDDWKFWKRKS